MAVFSSSCRRFSIFPGTIMSRISRLCIEKHVTSRRLYNTAKAANVDLWNIYKQKKDAVNGLPLPRNKDPTAVFCNNELDLHDIEVYGFDYDYTLACYKDSLHYLIYNLGRDVLVNNIKYPNGLLSVLYNPGFAVRGLHCDVRRGFLLKIDSFHNIQCGTVYKGLQPVSDEEVRQCFNGTHVSIDDMSGFYGRGPRMHQLMDLFALPEMTLFSNVIEYFDTHDIGYDPEYVFYDVKNAVQGLHSSGVLHKHIVDNLDKYVGQQTEIAELLQRLSSAGKKMFLITNSGPAFVDQGMSYLAGRNWHELFDVVVTNARKPKFFIDSARPFRSFNRELGTITWNKVDSFKKGHFYQEGNFYTMIRMTDWAGSKVLYFGDHVYTDLADATLKHGWRTGAIIPELLDEIKITNTQTYKHSVRWLIALEHLISDMQVYDDPESQQTLQEWLKERNQLRLVTKQVFNPQFGSLFRTYHNATYFTRRLNRFADVYMSSVSNLLNYSTKHTFYPRRSMLPHESDDQLVLVNN